MSYTLTDLLQSQAIPQVRQITALSDFADIPIRAVSVQELPLDQFIRKDELVLTTAIGCDKAPALFAQLIQGAIDAQAAAIFFSFCSEDFRVPPAQVAYAEAHRLPLFQLPWDYRFSEFQMEIIQAIQEQELALFKSVQGTLFHLLFENQPMPVIVSAIAAELGLPVAVTGRGGAQLARSWAEEAAPSEEDYDLLRLEIEIQRAVYGYLCIYIRKGSETALDRRLAEKYIAFPLSLWFNQKRVEDMTAAKIRDEFVWNLATKNYTSFEEMSQQGLYLQFDLSLPYTCVVLWADLAKAGPEIPKYSMQMAKYTSEIAQLLLSEGLRQQVRMMEGNRGLHYILYPENRMDGSRLSVNDYLDAVEKQLAAKLPDFLFYWGISEYTSGRSDFNALYNHASLALQYCVNERNGQRRFTYKDTKRAQIASALSEHPAILSSARETLQPLLDYDATSDIGLLETLKVFIQTNYNTSETARKLHIHRQSLLYRLKKIEALTGMSTSDHEDLFVLEAFSRIYKAF